MILSSAVSAGNRERSKGSIVADMETIFLDDSGGIVSRSRIKSLQISLAITDRTFQSN